MHFLNFFLNIIVIYFHKKNIKNTTRSITIPLLTLTQNSCCPGKQSPCDKLRKVSTLPARFQFLDQSISILTRGSTFFNSYLRLHSMFFSSSSHLGCLLAIAHQPLYRCLHFVSPHWNPWLGPWRHQCILPTFTPIFNTSVINFSLVNCSAVIGHVTVGIPALTF